MIVYPLLLAMRSSVDLGSAAVLNEQHRVDGIKQGLFTEWLLEEINCAGGECLHSRLPVAMRGDKDNGDMAVGSEQLCLQLKAAHTGQPQIQHQASCFGRSCKVQKVFGRSELIYLESDRFDEPLERRPNRFVVIND